MHVDVQADTVRDGVLGLVLALVEVIKDALELQALKRVDSGELGDDEVERLGQALVALDEAIEGIKVEQGIEEAVAAVRGGSTIWRTSCWTACSIPGGGQTNWRPRKCRTPRSTCAITHPITDKESREATRCLVLKKRRVCIFTESRRERLTNPFMCLVSIRTQSAWLLWMS
jgi:hypothetical protein